MRKAAQETGFVVATGVAWFGIAPTEYSEPVGRAPSCGS